MKYKVADYKKSINHLLASIKRVSSEYEEHDRKHDLAVLLMLIECLKGFVAKSLQKKVDKQSGVRNKVFLTLLQQLKKNTTLVAKKEHHFSS